MAVVLDLVNNPRPRHPEKAHRPDSAAGQKARLDPRQGAGVAGLRRRPAPSCARTGCVTVCEEAGCPNIGECWEKKHATFMIMGDTCTRACAFCNVKTGLPGALDPNEPGACRRGDRQARPRAHRRHLGRSRRSRRWRRAAFRRNHPRHPRACPRTTIEILTPDFLRKDGALEVVVAAKPDVFNHNLETVPSLYLTVRPGRALFPFAAAAAAGEGDRPGRCSPSRASWWAWARSVTKCCR